MELFVRDARGEVGASAVGRVNLIEKRLEVRW